MRTNIRVELFSGRRWIACNSVVDSKYSAAEIVRWRPVTSWESSVECLKWETSIALQGNRRIFPCKWFPDSYQWCSIDIAYIVPCSRYDTSGQVARNPGASRRVMCVWVRACAGREFVRWVITAIGESPRRAASDLSQRLSQQEMSEWSKNARKEINKEKALLIMMQLKCLLL
jgi:hypothetical protein